MCAYGHLNHQSECLKIIFETKVSHDALARSTKTGNKSPVPDPLAYREGALILKQLKDIFLSKLFIIKYPPKSFPDFHAIDRAYQVLVVLT